jgi:urease accessory protein
VVHVGPGVMAGDRLMFTLAAEPGAQAVVVAQSATKLHAMDDGADAEHVVRVRVAAGASLEVHPGLTIPFARSAYRQRIEVELDPDARFVLVERWASGRVARGERHAYRRAESRLHVRVAGRLVYADALVLDPACAHQAGVFDGHSYLATGVAFGVPASAPNLPLAPPGADPALALVDLGEDRTALRALGHDGVALQRALTRQMDAWRRADGRPALALARFGS